MKFLNCFCDYVIFLKLFDGADSIIRASAGEQARASGDKPRAARSSSRGGLRPSRSLSDASLSLPLSRKLRSWMFIWEWIVGGCECSPCSSRLLYHRTFLVFADEKELVPGAGVGV